MKDRGAAWIALAVLAAANCISWFQVFNAAPVKSASLRFLDVGQGDSILLELPGGVRVLTDAGPDAAVTNSLASVLPQGAHSIDIAIVTHPELDHFNGFNYLLEEYRIGAFLINGRDHPGSRQWAELLKKIAAKNIPLITLRAGDAIRYGPNRIDILSPTPEFAASSELNDGGVVEKVRTLDFTALLTADTGVNVEESLRQRYDLSTDILKIGHHGSKYSSGATFLEAVHPTIAVVSSGARNSYGHPAPATLGRLAAASIPLLRTDQHGTVTIRREDGKLRAFAEK